MRVFHALLLCLSIACAQVTPYKTIDETQISEVARIKLNEARDLIRDSKFKEATRKLAELSDEQITPVEKALKYNLKGVALFNLNEFEKANLNFEVAEKYSPKDTQLFSQVLLNLASGHFKLNQYNELKQRLDRVDRRLLSDLEKKKFAQLSYAYGTKFENPNVILSSAVYLLGDAKSFDEITKSTLYPSLRESFKVLNQAQKISLLEEFNKEKYLVIAHLAQLEAEERYLAGDKDGAKDVVSWLRSEFGTNAEVLAFIKDFENRIEQSARINLASIGLVLPLSGEKSSFGQKALSGVDAGLKVMGIDSSVKIHTKDTLDSPAQAAQAVVELIREERVAFIIGGLFPESARAEYLEARRYGVLYISLSQINLPKEEKNHHLIEVQGSIESQVETLLKDEMIKKFGTRIGVLFPDNEGGRAYVDEIWRKANAKNLQLTSIASFPKNTHDYRDSAQLFLGLKYPRERSEELKILEDVYSKERSAIRRVQTLPPVMDFDWVFVASYPHEAAQLIPTLGYYDANRLKVIGGPSWVSNSLVKEQKNLGTLYFVGDDPHDLNQEILKKFQELYGKPAGLIEILALDGLRIGAEALTLSRDVSSRDGFDSKLKNQGKLVGLSTQWLLNEGVWLKQMNAMTITRGEIVKLFPRVE